MGSFVKYGNKWGTTYAEKGDEMWNLVDDFYAQKYAQFSKSTGGPAAGYWADPNGYFNAIMGKETTATMYACDNTWTMIGARPYNHEGCRLIPRFADYGYRDGHFKGIGATTAHEGLIPDPVTMPVDEVRMPYKELPFAFNYGLGLMALENKDDTVQYRDYMDKMAKNYAQLLDMTLLRPITEAQPTAVNTRDPFDNSERTEETSLNGLSRLIASGSEIGKTYGEAAITADHVLPYGGVNGDFMGKRAAKSGESVTGKLNTYSANVLDSSGTTGSNYFNIAQMKKLYRQCSINWEDSASPNNKIWLMSNLALDAMSSQLFSQNLLLDNVYVQRSFNGVKTMPGRADAGMVLNSYNNIPIVLDGNLNFDYNTYGVSSAQFGDVFLLDLDHLWVSTLTPVEMFNINNPAITRELVEYNVMHMRAETRIDSFIQHGRITNIAGEDTTTGANSTKIYGNASTTPLFTA